MTIRVKINLNTGKKKAPTHRIFNDVSGLFTWRRWPDVNRNLLITNQLLYQLSHTSTQGNSKY